MKRKGWVAFVAMVVLLSQVSLCLVLSGGSAEPWSPYYIHLRDVQAGLSISGSSAHCTGSARGRSQDTTTSITVTLYEREIGFTHWSPVRSWGDQASGTLYASVDEYASATDGFEYYVKTSATIRGANGGVIETGSATSPIRTP